MTDAPVDLEELKRLLAEGTQGAWKIERGKRCIQGPDTFEGDPLVITSIMGGSRQWSSSPYGEYCTTGMKEGDANAALIVAAVNSLAALIARVERANELEVVLKSLVDWDDDAHPMRTADWHNPGCKCIRCRFDLARDLLKGSAP